MGGDGIGGGKDCAENGAATGGGMTTLQELIAFACEAQAQAWEAEAHVYETFQAELKRLGVKKRRAKPFTKMEEARQQASRVRGVKPDASQARGYASHARERALNHFVSDAPAHGIADDIRSIFRDTFPAWKAAETAWRKAGDAWEAVADAYGGQGAGTPEADS